jgi:hypothetical protein
MKVKYTADIPGQREIELVTRNGHHYKFPYDEMDPMPTSDNPIERIYVDPELAFDGSTYVLASGSEGAVLLDHVFSLKAERRLRRRHGQGKKRRSHRYVTKATGKD